jgi:DNA-binding MarR family transcriptional regulator
MSRAPLARKSVDETGEKLEKEQYQALARFRYALRAFLAFSEQATRKSGFTTQQYQALLAIKASPDEGLLVGALADQLLLKHNNTVQLVDRLSESGLVRRNPSRKDRRAVVVTLTARGEAKLAALASVHYRELLSRQKELSAISRLANKMEDIA